MRQLLPQTHAFPPESAPAHNRGPVPLSESELAQTLDRILREEQLSAAFQPIVCPGRQEIYGYEGLIRGPDHTPLHSPVFLFETAVRQQRLLELDFLCRKTVIRHFVRLGLPGKLFINVSPVTLLYDDFVNGQTLQYLNAEALDPSRVVIEITETHQIDDINLMQAALQHYRNMGFMVALDDLGAGYSGLTLWSQMNPDFVKIDRHFIQGVGSDKTKRQFIKSIIEIAQSLGCKTVTEGVETRSEYETVCALGANFVQGYYLDRPSPAPALSIPPERVVLEAPRHAMAPHKPTAGCMLQPLLQVSASALVEEVDELFRSQAHSIAVVRDGEPLGLVLRDEFMNLLASRYGRDLHGRKPISKFMTRKVLMVEKSTPLEKVSKYLTNAVDHYMDEFIITDQGQCVGRGTLIELLRRITEQQIHTARYANPLTLLPGNVLIQKRLDQLLEDDEPFVAAYCDLDHFKPFNDVYGYARGDDIIRCLAELLTDAVGEDDFVGHVGGDDFILLFKSPDWRERCQRLLDQFRACIVDYYNPKDRDNGGIETEDRFGIKRHFPFMALSVGLVRVVPGSGWSKERFAESVALAKTQAKKLEGCASYLVE